MLSKDSAALRPVHQGNVDHRLARPPNVTLVPNRPPQSFALELHRQLPFTTSSTIKKRKMSRPEDLPRSASPLKRRAPSLPPDESPAPNADATEDVDMISIPATSDDVSMGDSEPVRGTDHGAQEGHPDRPKPGAQDSPGLETGGQDVPGRSGGLEADRTSVEETQAGSEHDEDAPATGAPLADDAQGQDQDQERGGENSSASTDRKVQGQNALSSNSEDAADSDAKTVDTVATSASLEPLNQSRRSKCNHFMSIATC